MSLSGKLSLVALFAMMTGHAAQARPCTEASKRTLINSLQSAQSSSSETMRGQALFALDLVQSSVGLRCEFQSGIAGNVYMITTPSHKINASLVGSELVNISFERLQF